MASVAVLCTTTTEGCARIPIAGTVWAPVSRIIGAVFRRLPTDKIQTISVGLVIALYATRAGAEFSANQLYTICRVPQSEFCLGYVVGVTDMLRLAQPILETSVGHLAPRYCAPDSVTKGQLVDVVTVFLRDRAEHRHEPALELVLAALASKFPCE